MRGLREPDPSLGAVRRIAVFRALGLGDLICATPALRALRHRFPSAHITLIGLPWARDWSARQPSIDAFEAFPGHPLLPERSATADECAAFEARMRDAKWDLLVQLHGSGRLTNGLLSAWGARRLAVFHEPAVMPPKGSLAVPWPQQGSEAGRLMRLMEALGANPQSDQEQLIKPDFPLQHSDEQEAYALMQGRGWHPGEPFVCMHVGSQWPSRRWSVRRFEAVARHLIALGYAVVLTGVEGEHALADAVHVTLPQRCFNLVGHTKLWTLGALIRMADLLVCNDTGVSHVAAALQTPSVVISCGSDVGRWAPIDQRRHLVLSALQPCGPCAHAVCPYAHACAEQVSVDAVMEAIQTLLLRN